jgi:thiol-disulfide isomerase/thioredoxin
MNKTVVILIALIIVFAASYFLFQSKATVGEETPTVSAKLVSGEDFKLSDLKGKTVYLVFWGSWCPPCRAELPHWVEFYNNKNDDNIELVSIALEKKEGHAARVSDKMKFPWSYQIEEVSGFVATNEFSRKYGVTDIPAAFKINPDGTLAEKLKGVPH